MQKIIVIIFMEESLLGWVMLAWQGGCLRLYLTGELYCTNGGTNVGKKFTVEHWRE